MFGYTGLLLGLAIATIPPVHAQDKIVRRDLQEWLDAQGTALSPNPLLPETPSTFLWVNNPDINGDGIDDGPRYVMFYDYAAVLAKPSAYGGVFGPDSITGTVTERSIGGGMAEVTVRLKVSGAFIWVTTWDPAHQTGDWLWRDGPTVFGHRETELLANPDLGEARADVDFTTTFLNEVGAPMPDLITSNNEGRWLSFHVTLNATGPLTEAFGVPEGTPGALHWGKPGTLTVPANPNADNGAASAFPNDQFHLFPIGRNY